jgi:RNA polymerase sigma factor (sigma-70 family)
MPPHPPSLHMCVQRQRHVSTALVYFAPMDIGSTTLAVQRCLDRLADVTGAEPAEPIIGELLAQSVQRLQMLCATMLHRSYPRLTHGPVNLAPDEMLGAVAERLIKALRQVRPQNVRQFFALANQHIRWELNDFARRLDEGAFAGPLRDSLLAGPPDPISTTASPNARRILQAIEELPEEEREVFNLIRIQGMTQPEAAAVIGVSAKTVKRRLDRGLLLLEEALRDLRPAPSPSGQPAPE